MAKHTLGLELYEAHAVAVAVDETGRVLGRASVASKDLTAAALATLDGATAAGSLGAVAALGVSAINPDAAECRAVLEALAPRYAGPFARDGASTSGTAAAMAETWIGAARGARDVVLFSVAEHTSAGIVRDGAPLVGSHRRAPAIAWLALNPVEREDYRKTGCLEAEVAAAGIVRRLVWRIKAGDRSDVQDAVNGDFAAITVNHVLDAARSGDGVSISVVRDTAKYLGMAAANLVVIADPAVLVLGGIMASAADLLFELVRTEIARRVPPIMMQMLTIEPAVLGADAAAIGAARLAMATLK
jgi:predicted NBD/HSP70 family sugar kinase